MEDIKIRTQAWWRHNLANVVTVCGVVSAFLFLRTALLEPENIPKQILWAVFTAVTDFLDGWIARSKEGTVTIHGSYMDRIRDRIFIFPGMFILAWQHREKIVFPELLIGLTASLILFEIFIFRIGFLGYWGYRRGKVGEKDLQSSKSGKKKMFAGFATVLVWLISLYLECNGIVSLRRYIWLVIYIGLMLMNFWSYVSWHEYLEREIEIRKKTANS